MGDRVYDPVKAREYYLRTRHLKGRRVGQQVTTTLQKHGHKLLPTVHPVVDHPTPQKDVQAVVDEEMVKLKERLRSLKILLATLVKEAKARSGIPSHAPKTKAVVDPAKKQAAKAKAGNRKAKPKTASEKTKAAINAKKYYDKTHPEQAIRRQIAEVEAKIRQAVERARTKVAVPQDGTRP